MLAEKKYLKWCAKQNKGIKLVTESVNLKDEDGWIFARCKELHANSQGKTDSEAIENVKEAINLVIEELKKSKDFSLKIVRKYQ